MKTAARIITSIRHLALSTSLLALAGAAAFGTAEAAERRVAFVVGNSAYSAVPQLPNPRNDAESVAKALRRSGFEVVTALDMDRMAFEKSFERFVQSMAGADLSVFYYSGHGIQVNGDNRIVPTDADLKAEADLEVETISVDSVVSYMQSNSKVQLVYLDSCRNNPFPQQSYFVGTEKKPAAPGVGLAPMDNTLGSLVAFSTQPGEVAVDGTGDKSPFTESVLKHSFKLGVDVQAALAKVTQEVYSATNERQKPWSNNTLTQPVYLAKPLIRISAKPVDASTKTASIKIGSAPKQEVATAQNTQVQDTPTQIAAFLEESFTKPQRVPIGVGQVAMLGDFPIVRAATGAQIQLAAAPKSGVMYLDGKALAEGDVVDQDSLRKITYEPSIGSQQNIEEIELKVTQADATEGTTVRGQIEPFVVACDDEAGEPLDLQGVGAGKLPNEINPDSAIAACMQAIAEFPAVARYKYQLGRAKLAAKDVDGSVQLFNTAAEAGHTRAFNQLGYMAQRGLGRKQDITEANRLFKVGADLGDPFAMLSFGRNLTRGRGVEKNVAEGIRLMNKAVELGHTYAMNALGAMYYYGENLKANPKRGVRFYEASLARGDIYAMHNLGIAYLEGKGVAKDTTTALALFKKASEGGHPNAPVSIGAMYYNGTGVKKNLAEAIGWYETGAERGDFWAASNLSFIYASGPKDLRDAQKAVTYASLAVALDVYDANKKERDKLKSLPVDAKKKAMKKLISELGSANLEVSDKLDESLVMLSRKAWQIRNPRLDLF